MADTVGGCLLLYFASACLDLDREGVDVHRCEYAFFENPSSKIYADIDPIIVYIL